MIMKMMERAMSSKEKMLSLDEMAPYDLTCASRLSGIIFGLMLRKLGDYFRGSSS